MTNQIAVYNFKNNQVRTQSIDGNPWFCLADCANALGIKNAATSVKLSGDGVGKTYTIDNLGRQQQITIINEPNLYRLIFRSNKPQAQAFADWVYSEVLPSIRKTGTYGVPATVGKTVMVQEHIRALPSAKKEIVLSEKAKKEIGNVVKNVIHAEVVHKDNIRELLREVIREEVADFALKGGVKRTKPFNTALTADGLPPINWVVAVSHGATALHELIKQYEAREKELINMLECK